MIRISRLTDYGIVLMSYMATHPERVHNAAEVAADAHLPLPTVSKLLRLLTHEGLLESHRGVKGGYLLAKRPEDISLAGIIRALDGPIALTTCTTSSPGDCEHEPICPLRSHWRRINLAIRAALESIPLSEMSLPAGAGFFRTVSPTAGAGGERESIRPAAAPGGDAAAGRTATAPR
jgi:FeS assembly SUF system regulator